ncbi:hypothetical protein GS831_24840 [Rhodococcus hoagii]|nr:hypothetical protein [Prescottella equi]
MRSRGPSTGSSPSSPNGGFISAGPDPKATEEGQRLARIYSESDLLVAECLRRGAWKGLTPAETRGRRVPSVVYESVRMRTLPIGARPRRCGRRWPRQCACGVRCRPTRSGTSSRSPREPDSGFVTAIYQWANDEPLVDVLVAAGSGGKELAAGDFVRWCRQVIDLLDQFHATAPDPAVAKAAARAIGSIRRGVVAISAA